MLYPPLFFLAFCVFWFSGEGHPTYFNYYVRLSDAFLQGRLYLQEQVPWLNELIPFGDGRFYVVYPPLPAIVMMPLVALFGVELNQTFVSVLMGSVSTTLACVVAKDVLNENEAELTCMPPWDAILFGFGTIFWYLTSVGSAWYLAHVLSVFFLSMAINETLNRKRPLLMGIYIGASYWCRLPTILTIVFFAVMIISEQSWGPRQGWKGKTQKASLSVFKLFIGAGVFVALNMLYNLARFCTLFDIGYWLIPGILDEPWFSEGLFSLSYIPSNLATILTGLPVFIPELPFMLPQWTGMAIWLTTPAFIYAFKSQRRESITWACWLAIIAVASVIFTKGRSGWGFGYRYAMDFYPFLYVLTVKGMGERIRWHHEALVLLSIAANLWGVVCINKFGLFA
ncbi:MAG: hypothetical protein ACETV1_04215 [Candidatus Bathyarchaeia archaeon]